MIDLDKIIKDNTHFDGDTRYNPKIDVEACMKEGIRQALELACDKSQTKIVGSVFSKIVISVNEESIMSVMEEIK